MVLFLISLMIVNFVLNFKFWRMLLSLGTGDIIMISLMLLVYLIPFILLCWLIVALIRYLNRKSK